SVLFLFPETATAGIYTLSLHDALPIYGRSDGGSAERGAQERRATDRGRHDQPAPTRKRRGRGRCDPPVRRRHGDLHHAWLSLQGDRKSTRLNSSHRTISYAVFCLKKKT